MTSASLGHNTEETEYIEILSHTFQPLFRAFISTSLLPRLTFSRFKGLLCHSTSLFRLFIINMYGNATVSSFDMSNTPFQVTQMSLYLNGCGKDVIIECKLFWQGCFYFSSTVYVKYVLAVVIVMDRK